MKRSGISTGRSMHQLGLFLLFLLCGFLVFVLGLYYPVGIPKNVRLVYKIALSASFLAAVVLGHRNKRLGQYRQVFFAFFIASLLHQILPGQRILPAPDGYLMAEFS